ncbi:MAG: hypothetical protein R2762_13375 [Bryobacteraceae bacterium]
MRRLIVLTLLVSGAAVFETGCKSSRRARVTTVEEESGALRSRLELSDPATAIQLVKGFHQLEPDGWRWTMGQFTVTLLVPKEAAKKGGKLKVELTYPEPVLAKLGAATLKASVDGLALEPQTYSAAGGTTYEREIPASALGGETVTIDFSLDKFLNAGDVEERELGMIVSAFELSSQ